MVHAIENANKVKSVLKVLAKPTVKMAKPLVPEVVSICRTTVSTAASVGASVPGDKIVFRANVSAQREQRSAETPVST